MLSPKFLYADVLQTDYTMRKTSIFAKTSDTFAKRLVTILPYSSSIEICIRKQEALELSLSSEFALIVRLE